MHSERRDRRAVRSGWLMLLLVAAMAGGCQRKVTSFSQQSDVSSVELAAAGDFDLAMGVLFRLEQFEPFQAREQILYNLNQWAKKQPPNVEWIGDPLFNQLPSKYPESQSPETLAERRFRLFDVFMLQEAVWMRNIARWVSSAPLRDPLIETWLAGEAERKGVDHAERIGAAYKLFDWVVRNVQLDSTQSPHEAADERQEEGSLSRLRSEEDPHPPGVLYAWEALLLGHGDYLERSRIFVLLARQHHLPVVMLGIQQPDQLAARPWLTAALIGQDLYLFDLRLGLPVPTTDGAIATLQQVRDDPSLLARLDLPGEKYPVTRGDLQRVVALIDATPSYLSQRMKMIESNLSGEQKLVLSVAATPLRRELDKCPGLAGVRLWTQPYESLQYHQELMNRPQAYTHLSREMYPFDRHTPLEQGRILHFQGEFDDPQEAGVNEHGAKYYYLMSRPSDAEIDAIGTGDFADQLTEEIPEEMRDRAVEATRAMVIRTKQAASYWLGLINFDSGDYRVAVDFFRKRTLDRWEDGPWNQGARYNLARSLEALGIEQQDGQLLRQAQQQLREDHGSPQHQGNVLRAQRIEQLISALSAAPPGRHALSEGGSGLVREAYGTTPGAEDAKKGP